MVGVQFQGPERSRAGLWAVLDHAGHALDTWAAERRGCPGSADLRSPQWGPHSHLAKPLTCVAWLRLEAALLCGECVCTCGGGQGTPVLRGWTSLWEGAREAWGKCLLKGQVVRAGLGTGREHSWWPGAALTARSWGWPLLCLEHWPLALEVRPCDQAPRASSMPQATAQQGALLFSGISPPLAALGSRPGVKGARPV